MAENDVRATGTPRMPDPNQLAQLSPEEKNAISHRGKALEAFKSKLEEYLKKQHQL